jgi:hypothetical protein
MSEESKERSLQKLAKGRRVYLTQARMLTEDERPQEAAEINKALSIKAPKGRAAATTLDTAPGRLHSTTRLPGEQRRSQGGGHPLP